MADGDKTLTAVFHYAQRTYRLTTAVFPPGGGAVTRYPDKAAYTVGERVTVTATPAEGYAFIGWIGAMTGKANRLTVVMDNDMDVTANFYRQAAAAPPRYTQETVAARSTGSGSGHETAPGRRPAAGFSLGYGFSKSHWAVQPGFAYSYPISKKIVSLNVGGDIQIGRADYPDNIAGYPDGMGDAGIFGVDAPLAVLLQLGFFSLEAGVHGGVLMGGDETLFNAGFVGGAGLGFSKNRLRRYFYRFYSGNSYRAHFVGMWWVF